MGPLPLAFYAPQLSSVSAGPPLVLSCSGSTEKFEPVAALPRRERNLFVPLAEVILGALRQLRGRGASASRVFMAALSVGPARENGPFRGRSDTSATAQSVRRMCADARDRILWAFPTD